MSEEKPLENVSEFDASRKTVGAIYRDAQLANTEKTVEAGELSGELMKSLADDVNEAIKLGRAEWNDRDFYVMVTESKDLMMKKMIKRKLTRTLYRPWPEDDTIVWKIIPREEKVLFCWCLPHYTEMYNMIAARDLYDPQDIEDLIAWRNLQLERFGFMKDPIGNWIANPNWVDKPLVEKRPKILIDRDIT